MQKITLELVAPDILLCMRAAEAFCIWFLFQETIVHRRITDLSICDHCKNRIHLYFKHFFQTL